MPFQDTSRPGIATLRAELVEIAIYVGAHYGLKRGAGQAQIRNPGIKAPIVAIGQDVAIFAVKQRKALRNRFYRVYQLLFGTLALGDVLRGAEKSDALPTRIVFWAQLDMDPANIAVGPHPAVLDCGRRSGLDHMAASLQKRGDVVPVNERAGLLDR